MTNTERFLEFIEEIANSNLWEYEDGTPMQADAQAFLEQWYMSERIANEPDDYPEETE